MKPERVTGKGSSQGAFSIWQGCDFPTWLRLLAQRPPMHWSRLGRLAGITACSLSNSFFGAIESLIYGRRLKRIELAQDPVFILGHWRSGTTLLHNLLSMDPQFTYSNLYHVLFPHHFLLSERLVTRLTRSLLPKTRPMDNMLVSWGNPQEDELALCVLTLTSPYMMLAFQGDRPKYERDFTLQDVTPKERERWKAAFQTFLKKVTLRNRKTMLLKSPTHTYRVPLLLEMFPKAKFINIVRNPYAVYSSSVHLRNKLFEANALGKTNLTGMEEDVCVTYEHLIRTFEADRNLIAPGQLHELRFEDLEQDPVGELRKIYETLGLEGFAALEAQVTPQLDSLRKYRKNEFQMEEGLRRRLYERWEWIFTKYGYESGVTADQPAQPAQSAQVA